MMLVNQILVVDCFQAVQKRIKFWKRLDVNKNEAIAWV